MFIIPTFRGSDRPSARQRHHDEPSTAAQWRQHVAQLEATHKQQVLLLQQELTTTKDDLNAARHEADKV